MRDSREAMVQLGGILGMDVLKGEEKDARR